MIDILFEIIGITGAGLLLFAYYQLSRQRWSAKSRTYQLANLTAAALLVAYGLYKFAYANVLLNLVWLSIALFALSRLRSRR